MAFAALAFASISARAQSEGQPVPVIVDGLWSRGYAKAVCEAEIGGAPNTEFNFQKHRCGGLNPVAAALAFEDKLMNDLRVRSRCATMTIARYNGPTDTSLELYRLMAAPHWSLALSFKPAALLQAWSLSNGKGNNSRGESENPERMASDICSAILLADPDIPAADRKPRPNTTAENVGFLR